MKKLIMMMALAVGLTGFAAQNDKLISFYTNGPDTYADGSTVVDGECYALVWIKTGASFGGFNQDGSAAESADNEVLQIAACAKDGKCNGVLFHVAAERDATYANTGAYQVYLMDTRDAAGVPSAVVDGKVACVNGCGLCPDVTAVVSTSAPRRVTASLTAAGIEAGVKFTTEAIVAYADNTVVLDGERVVLVGYPEANAKFHGIDWNLLPVMEGETVQVIGQTEGGRINVTIPTELTAGFQYEVAILDTRRPDGRLSSDDDVIVRAWGSIAQGETTATVMNWHVVNIGESGTFYATAAATGVGKYFDFDPTTYLAPGYAAVTDGEKLWAVYALPVAYTNILKESTNLIQGVNYHHLRDPAKRQMELPASFPLDVLYQFDAFSPEQFALAAKVVYGHDITAMDQAAFNDLYDKLSPFFKWNADYEISFDDAIDPDTFVLAGWYDYKNAWQQFTFSWLKDDGVIPWVGSSATNRMERGKTLRLLAKNDYKPVWVTYEEICTKVFTFLCGVHNLSPDNWGKKMRVDLNLYENVGRNRENGRKHRVGTYEYTFKGPLNVKFYSNDAELTELAISTNHEGRIGFPMPVMSSGKDDEAFVGWTNANGVVVAATPILVREVSEKNPIKSWYTAEEPLELYASFKPAKSTKVTVKKTETSSEKSDIKVTEEWLEKNNITETDPEKIAEKLEEPQGEAQRPAWQNYLLGMDPDAELKVDKTNGKEDGKALVVSTVQVVAPDAGIKVGYSLDKVDENETGVKKEGAEQATKDLKIDLAPEGETPTGYYKMNVIFTPTTTTGGETTEGEKIKVPADNTIGVLRVESEDKIIPVAVPWTSLDQAGDVTVAEIVKTSSLTKDDMMHVYDQANKRYDNWTLNANGEWEAVQSYKLDDKGKVDYSKELDPPESKTVPRGAGVWLERQDTEKPFYLIGEYKNDNEAKSVVNPPAPESPRPEYNLIAPTGIEDTNLNEVKDLVEVNEEAVKDDKLMVLNKGIPNYYTFKNGKWGYSKQVFVTLPNGAVVTKTVRCEDDAVIPAGTGLWYISGKSGETKTIDWSQKVEAK